MAVDIMALRRDLTVAAQPTADGLDARERLIAAMPAVLDELERAWASADVWGGITGGLVGRVEEASVLGDLGIGHVGRPRRGPAESEQEYVERLTALWRGMRRPDAPTTLCG